MSAEFFKGFNPCKLGDVFGSVVMVQDYPTKYVKPKQGQPRAHHGSYICAAQGGFKFGLFVGDDNMLMFKASESLLKAWNDSPYVGYDFESMVLREYKDPAYYRVQVSYMESIGSKIVGLVSKDAISNLTTLMNGAALCTVYNC